MDLEVLKMLDAPAVAIVMGFWVRSVQEQLKKKDETIAELATRFANLVEKLIPGNG